MSHSMDPKYKHHTCANQATRAALFFFYLEPSTRAVLLLNFYISYDEINTKLLFCLVEHVIEV